jgi:hypothetical protein
MTQQMTHNPTPATYGGLKAALAVLGMNISEAAKRGAVKRSTFYKAEAEREIPADQQAAACAIIAEAAQAACGRLIDSDSDGFTGSVNGTETEADGDDLDGDETADGGEAAGGALQLDDATGEDDDADTVDTDDDGDAAAETDALSSEMLADDGGAIDEAELSPSEAAPGIGAGGNNPFLGMTEAELLAEGEKLVAPVADEKGKRRPLTAREKREKIISAQQIAYAAIAAGGGSSDPTMRAVLIGIIHATLKCGLKNASKIWDQAVADYAKANSKTAEEMAAEAAARLEAEAAAAALKKEIETARLWDEIRDIAEDPDLAAKIVRYVQLQGVVGEDHSIAAVYLTSTSRLVTSRALCLLRRGLAASGKNTVVEKVLSIFPNEDIVFASAGSPKSLIYYGGVDNPDAFAHKIIYFAEAAAIARRGGDESEITMMLRTLISEGRIVYPFVDNEARETVTIEKNGPTALLLTSARNNVEEELLTRLLLSDTNETAAQTLRVMVAQHEAASGARDMTVIKCGAIELTADRLKDFQRWLALGGPYAVTVPYAKAIAAAQLKMPGVPLRLRRDTGNLLTAVMSSAIIHKAQRVRDPVTGAIVATVDDYHVAHAAVADGLTAAYAPKVSKALMRLVSTLERLLHDLNEPVRAARLKFEEDHKEKDRNSDHWKNNYPQLIDKITITQQKLGEEMGAAGKGGVSQRISEALAHNLIEIVDNSTFSPRKPGRATLTYRLLVTSAELKRQIVASQAVPTPKQVEAMIAAPVLCDATMADLAALDDGDISVTDALAAERDGATVAADDPATAEAAQARNEREIREARAAAAGPF